MRYLFILFTIFLLSNANAQSSSDTITLKDLKTPNSPGFQILDVSPSSIDRPTNPKEFALNILNRSNNGSVVPKNFAIEVAPYWLFKPKNETVFKYLNVKYNNENNISTGILRKLSLSISSVFNDSATASLMSNTNYISFGARTNIITLRSKKQNQTIEKTLNDVSTRLSVVKSSLKTADRNDPDKLEEALAKDKAYIASSKKLKEELSSVKPPIFQLDVAYAYAHSFAQNNYENGQFHRSGFWVTAAFSNSLLKDKSDNLSFIAAIRSFNDNLLVDTLNFKYQKASSIDVGGKVEYTNGRFQLSVEYMRRAYSGNKVYNSERTVGLLQYKVNDNLYIVGTYGKNFGKINNVFALLGINWGWGSNPLSIPK